MFDFKDKVVVVTGGAQGIGKCICEEFEKAGAKVCVIDILDNPYFVGDIAKEEKQIKEEALAFKKTDTRDNLFLNKIGNKIGIKNLEEKRSEYKSYTHSVFVDYVNAG